jgi:hypothetical protein
VVNLLPHTAATANLLGAEALAAMPTGGSLINFGRGQTVDDDALIAALDRGHLDHAVLDVFDLEPLPSDHRYWHHASVTVLPHISGPTSADTAAVIAARRHGRPGPEGSRDLTHVGLLIGSGGVLRHSDQRSTAAVLQAVLSDVAGGWRLPEQARAVVDEQYLLAPIGLLALTGRESQARSLAGALLGP